MIINMFNRAAVYGEITYHSHNYHRHSFAGSRICTFALGGKHFDIVSYPAENTDCYSHTLERIHSNEVASHAVRH